MGDKNQLIYRHGRLQLPGDIVDWPAADVAAWLALLPLDDRVRAFRALPFSRGAIAYLAMMAEDRAALLAALDGNNRQRLVELSASGLLVEALGHADAVTAAAVLADLPESRRRDIEAQLNSQPTPNAAQSLAERRPRWRAALARVVAGRGPRRSKRSP